MKITIDSTKEKIITCLSMKSLVQIGIIPNIPKFKKYYKPRE